MPTIRVFLHPNKPGDLDPPTAVSPHMGVWNYIKRKYLRGYTIEEIDPGDTSFTDICKRVEAEDFDAAIGYFSLTPERFKYVAFSQPFMTDEFALYQRYDDPWALRMFKLFVFHYIPVILLILILGLVVAYGVYSAMRGSNNRRDSFVNALAAVFGNFEFIHYFFPHNSTENVALGIRICLSLGLLVISAFTINFIYAFITTTLLTDTSNDMLTPHTVRGLPILCPEGYSSGVVLQQYGADVTYLKGDTPNAVKAFESPDASYRGLALYYEDEFRYPSLFKSTAKFGMDVVGFPVNRRNPDLLRAINLGILELNDKLRIRQWCRSRPTTNIEYCVL